MFGRIAAGAALIALAAGCASMESAGRASRTSEGAPASAPAAAAAPEAATPAPVTAAPPPVVQPAPTASAQAATPETEGDDVAVASNDDDSDVVVPGVRERQVQPPDGDPRSNAERMQDIRAWDRCVTRVQDAVDSDPMSPQLESPEEYCRESLGMVSRTAVPASRLERQR